MSTAQKWLKEPTMSMTEPHPQRVYSLYGHQNPPPSKEVANERLDVLERDVQQVKVQIEFSDSKAFNSEDEFRVWKARAMKSIASYRAEMSYLRSYVNGGRNPDRVPDEVVKEVRKGIDKITKNTKRRYREIIGDGSITDVVVAEAQYAVRILEGSVRYLPRNESTSGNTRTILAGERCDEAL